MSNDIKKYLSDHLPDAFNVIFPGLATSLKLDPMKNGTGELIAGDGILIFSDPDTNKEVMKSMKTCGTRCTAMICSGPSALFKDNLIARINEIDGISQLRIRQMNFTSDTKATADLYIGSTGNIILNIDKGPDLQYKCGDNKVLGVDLCTGHGPWDYCSIDHMKVTGTWTPGKKIGTITFSFNSPAQFLTTLQVSEIKLGGDDDTRPQIKITDRKGRGGLDTCSFLTDSWLTSLLKINKNAMGKVITDALSGKPGPIGDELNNNIQLLGQEICKQISLSDPEFAKLICGSKLQGSRASYASMVSNCYTKYPSHDFQQKEWDNCIANLAITPYRQVYTNSSSGVEDQEALHKHPFNAYGVIPTVESLRKRPYNSYGVIPTVEELFGYNNL